MLDFWHLNGKVSDLSSTFQFKICSKIQNNRMRLHRKSTSFIYIFIHQFSHVTISVRTSLSMMWMIHQKFAEAKKALNWIQSEISWCWCNVKQILILAATVYLPNSNIEYVAPNGTRNSHVTKALSSNDHWRY